MSLKTSTKTFLLLFLTGLAISVHSIRVFSDNEKSTEVSSFRSFIDNDTTSDFPVLFESLESDSSKKTERTHRPAVSDRGHSAQVEFLPDRLRSLATLSAIVAIHRLRLILFPFHIFD
ncbi:hypothetical protein QWZ15_22640 [Cyclobacterium jeungdonense]|uniref:Uncharacterized protein n=1 Tax=Cyclobacterium jeungdonense TaxID=708087 RepID=A0ABT8CDY7_9BACT|nr:hypothetical protein [Cyclobacterium jeungdonense]MDN3690636.1 hypothetical protein [Cyclobacterium jeungdonense]